MKFLVLAWNAKSGLVLGVKVFGRSVMAYGCRPNFRGDPSAWGDTFGRV